MTEQTFVAREEQLDELNKRLDLALSGKTQFAFVVGEAGAGKTALLQHFVRRAQESHPDLIMTHGNCNAQTGISDPYLPFREILNLLVGIEDANLSAGSLTKENGKRISNLLVDSGRILLEIGPDLIGSFVPGGALLGALGRAVIVKKRTAERLDEIQKKQQSGLDTNTSIVEQSQVFEQYTKTLNAIAAEHPLVIIVDDLHWTDKASASLLFHLARRLEDSPALIIGTYRPVEVAAGSGNGSNHPLANVLTEMDRLFGESTLDLDHLEEEEKSQFFNQFIDTELNHLGEDFRTKLFEVTGGHPLFTVELLRHLQTSGDLQKDEDDYWIASESLEWKSMPVRIDGVIKGRVQRLDKESREILSAASLQGNQFIAEVVANVLDMKASSVIRKLSGELTEVQKLVRPKSVEKIAEKRVSIYEFQHNLFQQYLLSSVDVIEKSYLHEEIGTQLETLYSDRIEGIAPQLAYHFSEGDVPAKAIKYANIAGDRARLAYANAEAIFHYQTALKHLLSTENNKEAARVTMKLAQSYQNDSKYKAATEAYEEAFALRKKAEAQLPDAVETAHRAFRTVSPPVPELDPGAARGDNSLAIIMQIFSGLVEIVADGTIAPDGAQKWDILDEGKRYRFHLRKDVFWSDGNPITAQDYVFALSRIFTPELAQSNLSDMLQVIKGWEVTAMGKQSDLSEFGVRALKDYLLEVELENPIAYFLQLMGNAVSFPVPRHVVDQHGSAWTEPRNIVSSGPFLLKEYEVGKRIVLEKNDRYHRRFRGNLREVDIKLVLDDDKETATRMYANDELDSVDSRLVEARQLYKQFGADLVSIASPSVMFIQFAIHKTPFDETRVRKAFGLAIDRIELVGEKTTGTAMPALGGMVPPGIPGHIAEIGETFNIDLARQLLSEAGFPGGEGLPAMEFTVAETRAPEGQILCEQWKENLNIEVGLQAITYADLIEASSNDPPSFYLSGWIADFFDPESFLLSIKGLGQTRWVNETYLELVKKARVTIDQSERMELYRKAQVIIYEEAPVSPLFYNAASHFLKSAVKNFHTVSRVPIWRDVILGPDSNG